MQHTLLGGISPAQFLAEYWHKKPLLVRNALPGFTGLLTPDELAGLACEAETQARLVIGSGRNWQVQTGPFDEADFARLPDTHWSLLVQGVNLLLDEGQALLQLFDFIPHARLDDLMISYAPPGGSVGAHFDSYDVFLLQGQGHRRWQVSSQEDRQLVPGAPLKILEHFEAQEEWLLGPGDMLYLPPRYAHYGVAEDDCMTYSIGFRAPSANELAQQFLGYLQETLALPGQYADPDLSLQAHPAEISAAMLDQVAEMLAQIRWDRAMVADFLGRYLTEPKPQVFYTPPKRPLSLATFTARVLKSGLKLARGSQVLYFRNSLFINGETIPLAEPQLAALLPLADRRQLPPGTPLDAESLQLLYQWYRAGYLLPA
jgi:50S ribosomal protein L16 3-hydroxylase